MTDGFIKVGMLLFGLLGQDFKMLDPQLVPSLGELRFRSFVLVFQGRSRLSFRGRGMGFSRCGLRHCNCGLFLLIIQCASGSVESRNCSHQEVLRERSRCQR